MLIRSGIFFILWMVLDEGKVAGFLIGLPTSILAGWVSMRLFPPSRNSGERICFFALGSFVVSFLWNSIKAGVEVAYWAFHPRLPLRIGFVCCTCGIPAGSRRDLFLATCSLMPGSLPVGDTAEGEILLHCLNTDSSVCRQMQVHEASLMRIWKRRKG